MQCLYINSVVTASILSPVLPPSLTTTTTLSPTLAPPHSIISCHTLPPTKPYKTSLSSAQVILGLPHASDPLALPPDAFLNMPFITHPFIHALHGVAYSNPLLPLFSLSLIHPPPPHFLPHSFTTFHHFIPPYLPSLTLSLISPLSPVYYLLPLFT